MLIVIYVKRDKSVVDIFVNFIYYNRLMLRKFLSCLWFLMLLKLLILGVKLIQIIFIK